MKRWFLLLACEPVTPRGVAAYARAKARRLWFAQSIVAVVVAAAVAWLLQQSVWPTITSAIERLPETGVIRNARLDWNGDSPVLLAEGRMLAVSVDLNHAGGARSPAHWQVEFGRDDFISCSLLGCMEFSYPSGWWIAFNRTEVLPKWGAWEKPALGITALTVALGMMLTWQALATLYAPVVWLVGYFANRRLSFTGSWRLAGAALMPGALVMTIAIVLYGQSAFELLQLGFAFVAHLVIGWIYLIIGPWFVPQLPESAAAQKNPFANKPARSKPEQPAA